MRVILEPVWVLHLRPYRDTSVLLEVFSRDFGRVGLVARGVRSAKGRWRGLLQPLQPLLGSWSGRGELGTLTACESAGPAVALRDEALMSAWYVNELLLRLLQRNDPHPPLFTAYGEVLDGLARSDSGGLRVFEKRLLDGLGWGPVFDQSAEDGQAVVAGRRYGFSPERGVVKAGEGVLDVDGEVLLALAHESLDDPGLAHRARQVMRVTLDAHLGGKALQSRELLAQWRARRKAPPV